MMGCPYPPHPYRRPEEIAERFKRIPQNNREHMEMGEMKDYEICVNGKRQYIGRLEFWNGINKWACLKLKKNINILSVSH